MFNISGVELGIILLVALLLLGPQRLPEVARGLGKFLREFRRQTDDVRTMVEREFYQMDQDIQKAVEPAVSAVRESAEASALKTPDSSASGSSSAVEPPAAAQSAAPGGEALSSSDPGGTGELYDAEYHAAEANGLLPPSPEADPAAAEGSPATPRVEALEGPAAAQQPSSSEHQEPAPRAK